MIAETLITRPESMNTLAGIRIRLRIKMNSQPLQLGQKILFKFFLTAIVCLSCLSNLFAQSLSIESLPRQDQSDTPTRGSENTGENLQKLISQKRWEEAAQLAKGLADKRPYDPFLRYLLGVVQFHQKDFIGSIKTLRSAETLGTNTAALHKTLGLAYYSINQFILFEQQMNKVLKQDPKDFEPYYYLGRYYESNLNHFVTAIDFFERAILLKPNHVRSVYYRGYCLQMIGRHQEARENYESSIKLIVENQERFSWPYQSMARLLLDQAADQALPLALKAVELDLNLDSNYLILAKIYERLGKLTLALEALQAAARLNPTDSSTRYLLGMLYKKLGKNEAAYAELIMVKKLKAVYGEQ